MAYGRLRCVRCLNQAFGVVETLSPPRCVLPLCSVRWPVSCLNIFLTPCVFSLDGLSVKKTLYGTLCAASTSCEVVACRSRVSVGADALAVDAARGRFRCGARRTCAEQATADDRGVLNDLLGGIDPHRVECSGFTPLVERLLSLSAEGAAPQPLTRLLGPTGAEWRGSHRPGCVSGFARERRCQQGALQCVRVCRSQAWKFCRGVAHCTCHAFGSGAVRLQKCLWCLGRIVPCNSLKLRICFQWTSHVS